MTNGLNIDIQRTGFPVKIGTLELWFDSSLENLKRLMNVEDLARVKLEKVLEKAQDLKLPGKVESLEDIDPEMVNSALDMGTEFIAVQYDIIFGDGTFKKIYKKYPDIQALENALKLVSESIAKRIEEQEAERSEQVEVLRNEALNKKELKKQMVK